MSQIVPLVLREIKESLTDEVLLGVPLDDVARADRVKIGRWQDNPLRNNVYVTICGGDPDDPNYMDGIVTLEGMASIGLKLNPIAREFGGGGSELWYRRGICQVGCYWIQEGLTEEEAFEKSYDVLGRVEANIQNIAVAQLVDDYDERAINLFCYANSMFQSGGPPSRYIFRSKVRWACLTERPTHFA